MMTRSAIIGSLLAAAAMTGAALGDTVTLTTGDVLVGSVVERNDEAVVLDHPLLGRVTLPAGQVATVAIDPPADDAAAPVEPQPEPEAAAEPAQPVEDDSVIFVRPFKAIFKDWSSRFEVGFNGAEGNSENANIYAAFKTTKETETDRWAVDWSYFLNTSQGDRTRNDMTAGVLKDWLFPDEPWFYFATGRADYDEFQDWDYRLSGAGGVGYEFIKTETLDLVGRAGVGLTQEFGGDDDELTPEGYLGLEVKWQISPSQHIAAGTTFHPSFGDFGEYRVLSNAEWVYKLDREKGISLKIGVANEYESITEDDSEHNDLKYYGAFVIEF